MKPKRRYPRNPKPNVKTARLKYSAALPLRAQDTTDALTQLTRIFEPLFADENFVTLLRAEGLTMVPAHLYPLVERGRIEDEIE